MLSGAPYQPSIAISTALCGFIVRIISRTCWSEATKRGHSSFASFGTFVRPADGETLITEGKEQNCLYLILSGVLHVVSTWRDAGAPPLQNTVVVHNFRLSAAGDRVTACVQ